MDSINPNDKQILDKLNIQLGIINTKISENIIEYDNLLEPLNLTNDEIRIGYELLQDLIIQVITNEISRSYQEQFKIMDIKNGFISRNINGLIEIFDIFIKDDFKSVNAKQHNLMYSLIEGKKETLNKLPTIRRCRKLYVLNNAISNFLIKLDDSYRKLLECNIDLNNDLVLVKKSKDTIIKEAESYIKKIDEITSEGLNYYQHINNWESKLTKDEYMLGLYVFKFICERIIELNKKTSINDEDKHIKDTVKHENIARSIISIKNDKYNEALANSEDLLRCVKIYLDDIGEFSKISASDHKMLCSEAYSSISVQSSVERYKKIDSPGRDLLVNDILAVFNKKINNLYESRAFSISANTLIDIAQINRLTNCLSKINLNNNGYGNLNLIKFGITPIEESKGHIVLGALLYQLHAIYEKFYTEKSFLGWMSNSFEIPINNTGKLFLTVDKEITNIIENILNSNFSIIKDEEHYILKVIIEHLEYMSKKNRKEELVKVIEESRINYFGKINKIYLLDFKGNIAGMEDPLEIKSGGTGCLTTLLICIILTGIFLLALL